MREAISQRPTSLPTKLDITYRTCSALPIVYRRRALGSANLNTTNRLSVRLELQADFFAGVWARYADRIKHVVEAGDIEEAMRAASAVGDDRLQYRSRGYVVPDSFTHGTSEQRVRWFRRGYETGDIRQGDTFNARDL